MGVLSFGNAGNITRRGALAAVLFSLTTAATVGATFAPQPAFAQGKRVATGGFVFGEDVDQLKAQNSASKKRIKSLDEEIRTLCSRVGPSKAASLGCPAT